MFGGLVRGLTALMVLVGTWGLVGGSPGSETTQRSGGTTAAPASTQAKVKTFAIGDVMGVALRDGALEFPNDSKTFGVGRTPEEISALLAAADLPTDKLRLSIQPLVVKTADRVLLFDTGAGTSMGSSGGGLPASLSAAGLDPKSVTHIFISHAHGDHVGGLLDAGGAQAFPNATIHISAPEWAFLKGMKPEAAANVAGIRQHPALIAAMTPKVARFAPGAEIITGLVKAVEIRGHTPGHSGYLITSGQSSLLFVGDAMHHFVVSAQKPGWTVSFDADAPTAEASRTDLLTRSAASGLRLYAMHFPFPGVGKVEPRSDTFVWVPED